LQKVKNMKKVLALTDLLQADAACKNAGEMPGR
jgi:hypothetical protein